VAAGAQRVKNALLDAFGRTEDETDGVGVANAVIADADGSSRWAIRKDWVEASRIDILDDYL
jgi:hypothetical protein